MAELRLVWIDLFRDDRGQDIVEYALLTAFIGLAGILVWDLIRQSIGNTYSSWVTGVDSLAVPPAPTGGGS